jgi:SAM-dependent methyltransferase
MSVIISRREQGDTMRRSEARQVGGILAELPVDAISPCLNLGSSTRHFREIYQPHIHEYLFRPLEMRAVHVVHADLKEDDGVDIAGDIYDPETIEKIRTVDPHLVLCCNMFEHVTDREHLATSIDALVKPGGYVLLTVPFSYPLHYDPIDTYFRPSPEELAALFPNFHMVRSLIVSDATYLQDLRRKHSLAGLLRHFLRSGLKFFAVWQGKRKWLGHFHRYLWLLRPYKETVVLLQKG